MLDQFQQIPKNMKIVMGALACVAVLAVTAVIGKQALLVAVVGIVVVAAAMFLWSVYQKMSGQKRSRALSHQLAAHSSGAPSAIHDPALLAQLDRLRENFARGVEKFEAV